MPRSHFFWTFAHGVVGKHDTPQKGGGSIRHEDSKPYVYGDSLANIEPARDLQERHIRQGGGAPIRLSHEDYVVHETEYQTRCATVVLIDMSGSMGRYGKYCTTKKVAMALQAMVRAQYPQDSIQMVGFYTFASPMTERQLLIVAEAGEHVRQPGPPAVPPRRAAGRRAAALHQHPGRASARAEHLSVSRRRTSRSSSSPTASPPPTSRAARSS